MATTKQTDETRADDEQQAELEEVNQTEPVTKAGKRSAKAVREAAAEAARQEAKTEAPASAEAPRVPRRQQPNPLHQHGKKYREAAAKVDRTKQYRLSEALELAAQTSTTKFDAAVELHIGLGVDPRQADQMVRATVVLPHGTGRTLRVAVVAAEAKQAEAKAAGADRVGEAELLAEIEAGKLDFDRLIATPELMPRLGKVAKILGPRGLMPNPKSGTVTADVAAAVKQAKAGQVEFRIDRQAIVHQSVGRAGFDSADLLDNARTFIGAIIAAKPSAAKGTYVKSLHAATTMGPSVRIDVTQAIADSAKR